MVKNGKIRTKGEYNRKTIGILFDGLTEDGVVWYDASINQRKGESAMKKFTAMMAMEMCMWMCRMDMRCCAQTSMGFQIDG